MQKECLKIGNELTFEKARDMAGVEESALKQLQQMRKSAKVNTVKGSQTRNQYGKQNTNNSKKEEHQLHTNSSNMCRNCGFSPNPRDKCPARDMQCYHCHKTGHFARVCQSRKSKQVNGQRQSPGPVHVEVVDIDGPVIICNTTAQKLNLIRLNWPLIQNLAMRNPTKQK